MSMKDKIIVSFTSWPDRIGMATDRIEEMLSQTLQPQLIVLNLAVDDFPEKERSLPERLVSLVSDKVFINWCERDDKVFLKLLPAVKMFLHQDVLIATLDDDISYGPNYIAELYNGWETNGSSDKYTLDEWPDNGGFEVYRCLAFDEDVFVYLTPTIINNKIDDVFYRLYLEKKGKVCKHSKRKEGLLTILPKTTRGLVDTYAPNGVRDWAYINNAINEMKKSLGL